MHRDQSGRIVPPPDRTSGPGQIAPSGSRGGRIRSRESPLFTGLSAASRGTGSCSSELGLGTPFAAQVRAEVRDVRQVYGGRAELAGR